MHYLVTGANGQLGQEVVQKLNSLNYSFSAYDSAEMDILDKNKVQDVFKEDQPDVVFHCAAYTAVDKAEDEKELNWAVNVDGTRNIAEACKEQGALMIYISTDYVFDGTKKSEYLESDETNPKNEYGKAKRAGEQIVQEVLEHYYIVRTSWVFGEFGNNFVFTMQKLAKDRPELTIVSDQIGRPTWTRTLADFMLHLSEKKPASGVYHLSNAGSCSWFEFAKEILKDTKVNIRPILSEDFPQKADRPKHSVMSLQKATEIGFDIPHWKEGLECFLRSLS